MADRKPREVRSDFASDHSFSPGNFQEKQPFSNTEGGVFRFVRFFSPRRLLRFLTFRSGRILAQSLHLGHSRVPTHLQSAFDYSRLRVLALFLPFFLFAQLLSAPVVAVCLWSIDYWAALMLVACVESLVGLWTISKWPFLSSFCECPIRSWFAGREASPAKNLGYAWTYSQIARSLRLLNGALGVVWGWFLICVFHMPSEKAHIVAVIVCMGLFAPLLLCSVVSGAVEALVLPVVAAACLVMAQHFCGALAFLILSLFLETTVCGLFVIGVSRLARYLLQRLLQDRLEQRERNEIMSMMARGSDSHIGDWIWEIDANGCIQTPSDEFCTLLKRSSEEMAGMRLVDLLALPVIQPGCPLPLIDGQPMSASAHLAHCLANRLAFRDLCIPVTVGENTIWWLMTGRPVFRHGVLHGYRGIGANVTRQRNARSLYAERIRHDELTGLLNRLAFCEQLQSALLEKIALFRFGALLFLSLDNFFRDGVETQDETSRNELLSETGNRLRRFAKDKPGVAGRYGKAEFAFFPIVQNPLSSDLEDAKSLALELMALLEKPMVLSDGAVLSARVSAGIAPVSGKGQTLEILLEAADMALHDARGKTQERYSFYERLTLEDEERQQYLLQDVRQAVQERAFSLVYQPIVDAQTGAINGFEALSRWNGSRHGPLSIERVIGLIEVSGRGSEFDFWVLETACEAAVKWPSHLWVAVNMMASQFSQPQVAERILATLSRAGLDPRRLQIEVTETLGLQRDPSVCHAFQLLDRQGVRLVLDDFGTGFSTLSYLRLFPFSKIKLDTIFVQDLFQDSRSAAIVRNAIELAVDLGIAVTAEGVSSLEHYRFLRTQGCTEVQGYFLGRPCPAEDLVWDPLPLSSFAQV
ncbi:putative bifunctional diguanylate cyclase/phosphodiesterase [Gluconobacter thailandicus]|nr:EAL domain-containing protein [Gluconobacter thailandicus]KXV53909.1 diguanylate cyclase [Gluconobacter thailandicus]GAC88622.1 sensory box/GGDEF family protein [Gluconobacter thailandicus NBRC 3255]